MKTLALLVSLFLFLTGENLHAGQKRETVSGWLEKKHTQLSAVEDPASIRKVGLDQSEEPKQEGLYTLYPKKGYIQFEDGSWVLLTSHSAHADDGLADISLIRTSDGDYFSNRGHCCLPILLFSEGKVTSLDSFLKTTGKGPKAMSTPWIKYSREEDAADQPAPNPEEKPKTNHEPQSNHD